MSHTNKGDNIIITQKQPEILWNLYRTYKAANSSGRAYETIKKCLIHNNEPVNILVAVTALKDVQTLVNINWCHPVEYEYTLRYLSEVTGYSPVELSERVAI